MADAETDISAQTQTNPAAPPGTTPSQQCTSVPANVVEAINKSNDLVPALFALPCESEDSKKLRLCKRVGWLRDGVFTTGYMEINVKEAKQKGIFSQPRRVTLVKKEDSLFQSAVVDTRSKAPTCDQLSTVMLRRNSSTTAVIDVQGELIANTILVGKGRAQTSEPTGKLVAVNSPESSAGARAAEVALANADSGSQKAAVCTKPNVNPLESDNGIPHSKECDNNNTSKLSSASDELKNVHPKDCPQSATTDTVKDCDDKPTTTEYFLTEGGTASPMKRKSDTDSAQDFPATPAFRTLQHLMNIADADRKGSESVPAIPSASGEENIHETSLGAVLSSSSPFPDASARMGTEKSSVSLDVQAHVVPPSKTYPVSEKTVDVLVAKDLLTKEGKTGCDVFKLDLSSQDIPEKGVMLSPAKTVTSSAQTAEHENCEAGQVQMAKVLSEYSDTTTSETPVKSADSKFSQGNPEIHMETDNCKNSSSKGFLEQPTVNAGNKKDCPCSATSTESAVRDGSSPYCLADDGKRMFQTSSKNLRTYGKQSVVSGSSASATAVQQPPTNNRGAPVRDQPQAEPNYSVIAKTAANINENAPISTSSELSTGSDSLNPGTGAGAEGNSSCQMPEPIPVNQTSTPQPSVNAIPGNPQSEDPSKAASDGYPALRIGSVFSLSEKAAKELFPKPRPQEHAKPIRIKQEPADNYTYSTLLIPDDGADEEPAGHAANSVENAKKELISTSENRQGMNTASQFQPAVSMQYQNVQTFPFSNSSNVKLYNITTSKGSPDKRPVCTQVAIASPFQASAVPSNVSVSVPSAGLTNTSRAQPIAFDPAKQLYPTQPQRVSRHPVQIGQQQGTMAGILTAPLSIIKSKTVIASGSPKLAGTHSSSASPTLKLETPAILTLPVAPQLPGSKRIVITRVSQEVSPGARLAQGTSLSLVGGARQTIPVPSRVISRMFTALSKSESGQPVATGTHIITSTLPLPKPSLSSTSSRSLNKTIVVTGKSPDTTTPLLGVRQTTPAQESKSGLTSNPRKPPPANPILTGPKKTFLITTSNGGKRLVSLPSDADAAAILTQMANNRAYQFVVPQNAEDKEPEWGKVKKEKEGDVETKPRRRRPKRAKKSHKSSSKSAHKTKKKVPVLKIKFKKELEVDSDVRRSTRERRLKRPYSPTRSASRATKVSRVETPAAAGVESSPSPSKQGTEGTQLPFIKTEPVSPEHTYSYDNASDGEDSLLTQPPTPPSYVDREDRVKRLKELRKEKEKALEEILERRKREMEERLADPELFDL